MTTPRMPWQPLAADWSQDRSAVHVFRLFVANLLDEARLAELLPDYERQRAQRLRFARPRRQFLAARVALRQLLGHWVNADPWALTFAIGPHGKPRLEHAAAPEFNLSHSGDWVAVAIADRQPVGIDIEAVDHGVSRDRLAERYFSVTEQAELFGLPDHLRWSAFYRGWTCKEAWIKATGRGMGFAVERLTVRLCPQSPAELCEIAGDLAEASRWQIVAHAAADDAPLAVCTSRPVVAWRWWDAGGLLPEKA